MNGRVQELLGSLVEPLDELGGVLDVGKHHRIGLVTRAGREVRIFSARYDVGQGGVRPASGAGEEAGQQALQRRQSRPASCPPGLWRAGAPTISSLRTSSSASSNWTAPRRRDTSATLQHLQGLLQDLVKGHGLPPTAPIPAWACSPSSIPRTRDAAPCGGNGMSGHRASVPPLMCCSTWPGIGPGHASLQPPRDLHQDEIARDPFSGTAKTGSGRVKRLQQLHLVGMESGNVADERDSISTGRTASGTMDAGTSVGRVPLASPIIRRARLHAAAASAGVGCIGPRASQRQVFADNPERPCTGSAQKPLTATERTGQ